VCRSGEGEIIADGCRRFPYHSQTAVTLRAFLLTSVLCAPLLLTEMGMRASAPSAAGVV